MADPDYFIEISDFSPGIFSDFHATDNTAADSTSQTNLRGALPAGNGAATVENTFDCMVDKLGALIPHPKVQQGRTNEVLPGGNAQAGQSTRMPTVDGLGASYLLDARAKWAHPFNNASVQLVDSRQTVMVLYGGFYDPLNGSAYRTFIQGIDFVSSSSGGSLTRVNYYWAKGNASVFTNFTLPMGLILDGMAFTDFSTTLPDATLVILANIFNTNDTTGVIPAGELALLPGGVNERWHTNVNQYNYGFDDIGAGSARCYHVMVRTQTNTTVGFENDMYNDVYPVASSLLYSGQSVQANIGAMHQGRLLIGSFFNGVFGSVLSPTDRYMFSDAIRPTGWTAVGTARVSHIELLGGEDHASLVGTIGSVAASQVLLIHKVRGGILISGDLENPDVRRMPYVEGTGSTASTGVGTPLGYVYGSDTGVYVWAGGDTSNKLSTQLDGFFWDHTRGATSEVYGGNRGRFGYWQTRVYAPNNYVFDTEKGSWWRLSDTNSVPYSVYDTNDLGFLYAFPYKLTPTQNVVWNYFDAARLSDTYSWQSQPLIQTRGRRLKLQDIQILATHKGSSSATLTITLIGFSQDGTQLTSQATVFTMPANAEAGRPQLMRRDLTPNFQAEYIQVRIEANANNSADAAPKIHSVKMGVKDGAKTIRTT